jgi:hypothetical protein
MDFIPHSGLLEPLGGTLCGAAAQITGFDSSGALKTPKNVKLLF